MADRHKRPQRSIRLPKDLEAWIDNHVAEDPERSFNSVMVIAAENYRTLAEADPRPHQPWSKPVVRPPVVGYSKERQARGKR